MSTTISTTTPATIVSATFPGPTIVERPTRFDDDTSHRLAITHAAVALGLADEPMVTWDCDHVLQGHVCVAGQPFVLIAARTADRLPQLLSEQAWDGLRHGQGVAPSDAPRPRRWQPPRDPDSK